MYHNLDYDSLLGGKYKAVSGLSSPLRITHSRPFVSP